MLQRVDVMAVIIDFGGTCKDLFALLPLLYSADALNFTTGRVSPFTFTVNARRKEDG